jgi:hypothetical protein
VSRPCGRGRRRPQDGRRRGDRQRDPDVLPRKRLALDAPRPAVCWSCCCMTSPR